MIKLYHTFPACSGDYHGFVSPNYMMREIDEGVAAANFAEGAGFSHSRRYCQRSQKSCTT